MTALSRNFLLFLLPSLALLISCRNPSPRVELGQKSRDAIAVTGRMYDIVWDITRFAAPAERSEVTKRLDGIIKNFHRVGSKETLAMFEPGFTVTLFMHRQMLNDARRRLLSGDVTSARNRLKGLAVSCAGCHARLNLPLEHIGTAPEEGDSSPENVLSIAQQQFAVQKYDEAAETLSDFLATEPRENTAVSSAFILWLAAVMQDRQSYQEIAAGLDTNIKALGENGPPPFLAAWKSELRELETKPTPTVDRLVTAQELLHPALQSLTEVDDSAHLVKTLAATRILDDIIKEMPLSDKRRKASYLRAMATIHTPIPMFEVLGDMALEQCIREFPNSVEARRAFLLLEDRIEAESRTDLDLQISREQIDRLKELRALAFGVAPQPAI